MTETIFGIKPIKLLKGSHRNTARTGQMNRIIAKHFPNALAAPKD